MTLPVAFFSNTVLIVGLQTKPLLAQPSHLNAVTHQTSCAFLTAPVEQEHPGCSYQPACFEECSLFTTEPVVLTSAYLSQDISDGELGRKFGYLNFALQLEKVPKLRIREFRKVS